MKCLFNVLYEVRCQLFQRTILQRNLLTVFSILFLSSVSAFAQHMVPSTGTSSVSVCSGTVTDNGGSGNYQTGNGSLTIKPGTAGNYVKLEFTLIQTYNYQDVVYVYDGASTSGRLICSYYGTWSYSAANPKIVYATNPEGALTVKFVGYGGTTAKAGFSANISCTGSIKPADVVIEYPSLSNPYANAGGSLRIGYQLRNIGGAAAPVHGLGVYLSENDQYEASDLFLGSLSVAEMLQDAGGLRTSAYGDIVIPANTVKGKYNLILIDNYNNTFVDANPANNKSAAIPITVTDYKFSGTITTCSDTIADQGSNGNYYYAQDQQIVINPAVAGNMVKLDFTQFSTIANYDQLYIYNGSGSSAILLGTYSGNLSPGTVYATNTSGALTVRFYAASGPLGPGFKAGVSCVPVSALPPADLAITAFTSSVSTATNLEKITLTATWKNQGIKASSVSNMGFYISKDAALSSDDVLLETTSLAALGQGTSKSTGSVAVTLPANQAMGSFYILAVADKDNTEIESNETNNVKELAIIIDDNYKMPVGATAVERNICSGTLSDNGGISTTSVTGNGTVVLTPGTAGNYIKLTFSKFYVSGYLSIYDGPSTSAKLIGTTGGSYPTTWEGQTICATNSSGSLTLKLTSTGGDNFVADISCVNPAQYPDLEMSLLTVSPTILEAGSSVALSATLKNSGTVTAISNNVSTGFYLSKDKVYDVNDKQLYSTGRVLVAPGSTLPMSSTQVIAANTLPGEYYILAVTDQGNTVMEANKSNNVVFASITVTAPPVDLTVVSPTSSTAAIIAGSTMDLTAIVNNLGTKSAIATSFGYYLSADNVFETTDVLLGSSSVTAIGASASKNVSATVKIPASTTTGSYYIFFVTDNTGLQTETNETNNAVALPMVLEVTDVEDELQIIQRHIFPNPAQSIVTLGEEAVSIDLYNLLGQLLLTSKDTHIDVSVLNKGVYTCVVYYINGSKAMYKLVKE